MCIYSREHKTPGFPHTFWWFQYLQGAVIDLFYFLFHFFLPFGDTEVWIMDAMKKVFVLLAELSSTARTPGLGIL